MSTLAMASVWALMIVLEPKQRQLVLVLTLKPEANRHTVLAPIHRTKPRMPAALVEKLRHHELPCRDDVVESTSSILV